MKKSYDNLNYRLIFRAFRMDTSYLLKRYAIASVIAIIAISIISYLLEVFMSHDIGSAGSMVAVFIPAMDAGQTYARHTKEKPANGFAWKISVVFLLLNLAIGLVLSLILLLAFGAGGQMMGLLSEVGFGGIVIIAAVVFLIHGLTTRFFFGFGAKNELKAQEKLAAKKQP